MRESHAHPAPGLAGFRLSDHGTTLTELLVATALLTVVLSAAYVLLQASSRMADYTEAHAIATDETRQAMDRISQEVRQASALPGRTAAFAEVGTGTVTFYVDEDHDEQYERVTYRRDGTRLLRTVAEPIFIDGDYTFGAAGAPQVLVRGLAPEWNEPIFTVMLRPSVGATPTPVTPSQIASGSALVVHIRNTAKVGRSTAVIDSTTWVKIRAVENTVY